MPSSSVTVPDNVRCRRDLQTDADYKQQADGQGFVAISYVATLPTVRALTSDFHLVTSVLQGQPPLPAVSGLSIPRFYTTPQATPMSADWKKTLIKFM